MIDEDELKPKLYGLTKSNRAGSDLWGKNQFNSTFPAALACWMRDKKLMPVYLALNENGSKISLGETSFDEVFGSSKPNSALTFNFESAFEPFNPYVTDQLDHIDLVIKDESLPKSAQWLRALEVKLTVLPDSTTCELSDETMWGSELVIRPDSTSYAALSIYHSLLPSIKEARKLLEPTANKIEHWTSAAEILQHRNEIISTIETFLRTFKKFQIPFLIQPIWKTRGKSPQLDDHSFDIFVWSNFALCRVFVDQAKAEKPSKKVSRYLRACARILRCLFELTTKGNTNISRIYRSMDFGNQTDKEFALSGSLTNSYMNGPRLSKPAVRKEALNEIILNGGEKQLSPERRFDATIFFTAQHLFENKRKQ